MAGLWTTQVRFPRVRCLLRRMWPTDQHGIVQRDAALARGISTRRVDDAVRSGALILLARGRYLPREALADVDAPRDELYRYRSIASALGSGRPVLSHDSAAAVLGLKLLYPDQNNVHVTNGRKSGGSRRPQRNVHAGLLPDDDLVDVDGVLVTGPARTAVDVALATATFPQGLTAFDAALAAGVDREDLRRMLATSRRGVGLARRALSFADGRAESPGESWSRAQMIEAELPVPDLQVEYVLASGKTARCDFGLDDIFVGEFDGLVKYRRSMRAGESPEDVVIREKIREDELRDLGLDVGRWVWRDLRQATMVAKLKRRYDRLGIRY